MYQRAFYFYTMKKVSLFALLLFLGCLVQGQEIRWDPNRPVEWKDFQGPADNNAWQSATTVTQIKMSMKGKPEGVQVLIDCVFLPKRSWVKSGHKQHTLLMHERGHFELRELYARKMRKAIEEARITRRNAGRKIKRIYKRYNRKCNRANKKYDRQSDFSRDREGQAKWSILIPKELEEYRQYTKRMLFIRF